MQRNQNQMWHFTAMDTGYFVIQTKGAYRALAVIAYFVNICTPLWYFPSLAMFTRHIVFPVSLFSVLNNDM